ncbi:MAG: Zn-dependent alcohol dehydrogenase [Acidimicrobiia bacterium]
MTKAAVCRGIGEPMEVVEVDVEAPKAGEVKIRLGASGVCHSDLSVQNGTLLAPTPSVLGHEGAGVVEEVGEGVTNVKVGDHVVISWVPQCGECFYCKRGQPNLCETALLAMMTGGLLDGTSRFSENGRPLMQMASTGTFSESTVVPAISAVKIDDDVPLTSAALIGCGVLTGWGAAVNTADIQKGDSVVVLGCGGVGLNVIQGAKYAGAGKIIAVDMMPKKLEMAREFGATDFVDAGDGDPAAKVMELTEGRGADVAFEVIGYAETILQALNMTRRGGEMVIVGVPKMEVDIPVNGFGVIFGEKTIKGCWYGSCDVRRDIPKLVALYKAGELKLDELISREITLEDVNEAFDALGTGEVARSVIKY